LIKKSFCVRFKVIIPFLVLSDLFNNHYAKDVVEAATSGIGTLSKELRQRPECWRPLSDSKLENLAMSLKNFYFTFSPKLQVKKAEPSRLIPEKLTANLMLSIAKIF